MINLDATFRDGSLSGAAAIAVAYGDLRLGSVLKDLGVSTGLRCEGAVIPGDATRPALCWVKAGVDLLVVGFSGLTDVQLPSYLASLSPGVVGANGFRACPSAFAAASGLVLATLRSWCKTFPFVLLAGHSYGGVCCDAFNVVCGPPTPSQQRASITFGSPRPVPAGSPADRSGTRLWAWQRRADGISAFPPRGMESPLISQSISTLIGVWPYDFMHVTPIRALLGSGLWQSRSEPLPFGFFSPVTLPIWLTSNRGPIAAGHGFGGYVNDVLDLSTSTPPLWRASGLPPVLSADNPPALSNGEIQFRESIGFPVPASERC